MTPGWPLLPWQRGRPKWNGATNRAEISPLGLASFLPNDTEAVWELAEHRYVFIEVRPKHAGHAMHTLFVGDFDAPIFQIAERGLEPAECETYANGVRKATFRDPDGNEIGFGGAAAGRPRSRSYQAAAAVWSQTGMPANRSMVMRSCWLPSRRYAN